MNSTSRLAQSARHYLRGLASGRDGALGADPLGRLWRFLQAPAVWYACLAAATILVITALAFPSVYITESNAYGWPVDQWPGGYRRLVGLILLGSAPWSQAILAALALAAAVRAGATSEARRGDSARDQRDLLYSDKGAVTARLRLRLAATLLGYRLEPDGESPAVLIANSSWAATGSRLGLAVAVGVLALLCLAAPKITAAELLDLEAGYPTSSAISGLVLTASPGEDPTVMVEGLGEAVALRRGSPARLGDLLVAWHGSGPALQVVPVAAQSETPSLIVPFLPDEVSRYIAVPEVGVALRATLLDASARPTFQVQPLTRQGQPAADPYQVTEPTVYSVASASLELRPTSYQVVSVAQLPLGWVAAATLALLASSLAVKLFAGPSLRMAVGEGASVTTVEVESSSHSRRHQLLIALVRRLLG